MRSSGWIGLLALLVGTLSPAAFAIKASEVAQNELLVQGARDLMKLRTNLDIKRVSLTTMKEEGGYLYQELDLRFSILDNVRVWLRVPKNQSGPLPLVYVLGGVQSTPAILDLFPKTGNYIIAVYDFNAQKGDKDKVYQLAQEVAKQMPKLQGRIAAALAYMAGKRDLVDADRVNVIMVSFGSFVGPLAIRLADPILPNSINSTVIAFGGGSLAEMVLPKLKSNLSDVDYKNAERELRNGLEIFEPKNHLGALRGRFLIVNGDNDKLIPAASSDVIAQTLRGQKTVINLPVGHINRDHKDIVQQTIIEVEKWMKQNGAI